MRGVWGPACAFFHEWTRLSASQPGSAVSTARSCPPRAPPSPPAQSARPAGGATRAAWLADAAHAATRATLCRLTAPASRMPRCDIGAHELPRLTAARPLRWAMPPPALPCHLRPVASLCWLWIEGTPCPALHAVATLLTPSRRPCLQCLDDADCLRCARDGSCAECRAVADDEPRYWYRFLARRGACATEAAAEKAALALLTAPCGYQQFQTVLPTGLRMCSPVSHRVPRAARMPSSVAGRPWQRVGASPAAGWRLWPFMRLASAAGMLHMQLRGQPPHFPMP